MLNGKFAVKYFSVYVPKVYFLQFYFAAGQPNFSLVSFFFLCVQDDEQFIGSFC